MYHYQQFLTHVVRPTLRDTQLWSEAAETLLMGTVAVESNGGKYLAQLKGPALGAFQVEPDTHTDVWDNYLRYRRDRVWTLQRELGYSCRPDHSRLVTDLAYATYIARIIYLRVPEPLPHAMDVEGLANYWKQNFNTYLGSGSPEKFIDALQRWRRS